MLGNACVTSTGTDDLHLSATCEGILPELLCNHSQEFEDGNFGDCRPRIFLCLEDELQGNLDLPRRSIANLGLVGTGNGLGGASEIGVDKFTTRWTVWI